LYILATLGLLLATVGWPRLIRGILRRPFRGL
jgi:hypothetical protein